MSIKPTIAGTATFTFVLSLLMVIPAPSQAIEAQLVADLNQLIVARNSTPDQLMRDGNRVFFTAEDDTHGTELWVTDGSVDGTFMLKDIFPYAGSRPILLTIMKGILYFTADDGIHGFELWRSDGSAGGTYMVKDIAQGPESSIPFRLADMCRQFLVQNELLYFPAVDNEHGYELWRSDGTEAGTRMVKDISPGAESSLLADYSCSTELIVHNGAVYFSADDGVHGVELWRSAGTESSTELVADIQTDPLAADATPKNFFSLDNTLLFTAFNSQYGREIWATDGVSTHLVKDILPGPMGTISEYETGSFKGAEADGVFIFSARDEQNSSISLWRTDGTEAGTYKLAPDGLSNLSSNYFYTFDSQVFFIAGNNNLWRTNGSSAGTQLVTIADGVSGLSSPSGLFTHNGQLFFQALGNDAPGMWRMQGGSDQPALVSDMLEEFCYSFIQDQNSIIPSDDGSVYFTNGCYPSQKLWRTDGTAEGTQLVFTREIVKPNSPLPARQNNPVGIQGQVLFTHYNTDFGEELWSVDTNTMSLRLFMDISPGRVGDTSVETIVAASEKYLWFTGVDDNRQKGLWSLNRESGLVIPLVKAEITVNDFPVQSALGSDDILYFSFNESELWRSDGTQEGTSVIKDIFQSDSARSPTEFVAMNGAVYFLARDDSTNPCSQPQPPLVIEPAPPSFSGGITIQWSEFTLPQLEPVNIISMSDTPICLYFPMFDLWRSDGTMDGTIRLARIQKGYWLRIVGEPRIFAEINGVLVFGGDDDLNGRELWSSDGTAEHTAMLLDINPGQESSYPRQFTTYQNRLFLLAYDGTATALWQTDGTVAGTQRVTNLSANLLNRFTSNVVAGDFIYFTENLGKGGWRLWHSDGNAAGTTVVYEYDPKLSKPMPAPRDVDRLFVMGDELYLVGYDTQTTAGIWKFDSDSNTVVQVIGKNQAHFDTSPFDYMNRIVWTEKKMFFPASEPDHGLELWVSDGTSTLLAADIQSGPLGSNPTDFHVVGNSMYFLAATESNGKALWRINLNKVEEAMTVAHNNKLLNGDRENTSPESNSEGNGGGAIDLILLTMLAVLVCVNIDKPMRRCK